MLHLLAIAHEAGVELSIDDFDAVSRRTPHLADTMPSGPYAKPPPTATIFTSAW